LERGVGQNGSPPPKPELRLGLVVWGWIPGGDVGVWKKGPPPLKGVEKSCGKYIHGKKKKKKKKKGRDPKDPRPTSLKRVDRREKTGQSRKATPSKIDTSPNGFVDGKHFSTGRTVGTQAEGRVFSIKLTTQTKGERRGKEKSS